MTDKRMAACLKVNDIAKQLGTLREYVRFDEMPTAKIADEIRGIQRQVEDLFWMVDEIETAEEAYEKIQRFLNEQRG